jgi:hypothetical protein
VAEPAELHGRRFECFGSHRTGGFKASYLAWLKYSTPRQHLGSFSMGSADLRLPVLSGFIACFFSDEDKKIRYYTQIGMDEMKWLSRRAPIIFASIVLLRATCTFRFLRLLAPCQICYKCIFSISVIRFIFEKHYTLGFLANSPLRNACMLVGRHFRSASFFCTQHHVCAMTKILVLNAGSSSLKFKLFEIAGRGALAAVAAGICEQVGNPASSTFKVGRDFLFYPPRSWDCNKEQTVRCVSCRPRSCPLHRLPQSSAPSSTTAARCAW